MESPTSQSQDGGPASCSAQAVSPPFFSTGLIALVHCRSRLAAGVRNAGVCFFKCLTTRAVHIEVLSSINTDSFLMALRRFISRRGKPAELLSDQGTNFRGGNRELQEAFRDMHPSLQAELAEHQIKFCFNPPSAPHFGGSWEREIRSIKTALTATMGSQVVNGEVLTTTLIEIEGILNSKPIGRCITTQSYLVAATGGPVKYCPIGFWAQFLRHYLPTLQTRSKWQANTAPLQLGTVVMILDPQLPRASWPVGKISKVFPGADGLIRDGAEIKVRDRALRPTRVSRLIRLPAVPEDDAQ
ncbi:hypothetical protein AAFF_G00404390 [Aldrovandia affinis]|uniref:Integrase catalytic domain-containing protein n=1 Tax=Aldrovandia affinis TaxID=143900 RepID=A0AAD7T8H6_9TELE|nr:hypothetical protein AAFF_G00404390 [Aldrovandia affinis]